MHQAADAPEPAHRRPVDPDRQETAEWMESVEALVRHHGPERAQALLGEVLRRSRELGLAPRWPWVSDYVNTIPAAEDAPYPGDLEVERRILAIQRWNAAMMVHRANKRFPGLGGHISTYASSAVFYEVALNHFFRGKEGDGSGDQIYYQGHGSPGMYARAFLEGRFDADRLDHFRREGTPGGGLSSYPHPRLMSDYWEFPTVSMGLGPIGAIYQARFNRYLMHRGIKDTSGSRVWAFLGDGEMDEPESQGALTVASRDNLDNLVFVVNCNLQRLDGPVRGNAKIVQELESLFAGAGWRVIKVLWDSHWDALFANDRSGALIEALNGVVDGEWQSITADPIPALRERFFGRDPRLQALVEGWSDEQLLQLAPGGADFVKMHTAFQRATEPDGRPTVVLAQTQKGYGLGPAFAGRNATHQKKSFSGEELKVFRDLLGLPIADGDVEEAAYFHPGPDSEEVRYLKERRAALSGPWPARRTTIPVRTEAPARAVFDRFLGGSKGKEASTTMAFAQLLNEMIRDPHAGKRIVPIIPDEARTFGMDPYFRQYGIYSPHGQLYEPVDKKQMLYYREAREGQVLEEGITEAGSMASFLAAGSSHSVHGEPMIPFYIFYSMFGFQRTGDQAWMFGDMLGRGFMIGGTAGRTTLNGEGLQHQDGHSLLLASTYPSCEAWDPAFAYETALIVREGLERMLDQEEPLLCYITVHNGNYVQPPMPEGMEERVLDGLYPFALSEQRRPRHVHLFGSGAIMPEVLKARDLLAERFDVSADVWSAPSYLRLRREALRCERHNRLNPDEPRTPRVRQILEGVQEPIVAASDWMKAVPEQIARWVDAPYVILGTDGYGQSETRDFLRRYFEVDAESIAHAAFEGLRQAGQADAAEMEQVREALGLPDDRPDPASR